MIINEDEIQEIWEELLNIDDEFIGKFGLLISTNKQEVWDNAIKVLFSILEELPECQ